MAKFDANAHKRNTPKYNVCDEVWVMHNNEPKKMEVYAVVQELALGRGCPRILNIVWYKLGMKKHYTWYRLITQRCGACFNDTIRFSEDAIYSTRKELVDKLR